MDFSEVEDLIAGKNLENTSDGIVDRRWFDRKKEFKPVLRRNVTYVVAGVLFNEEGHVLLTQEGFHPHWGHWYLPAGRVDPGETLSEAAKREVREETGKEFEPTALLAVESPSGEWYRFTFTGTITGGKLRTLAEQDSETMQGAYHPVDTVMSASHNTGDPMKNFILRGRDILKLINCGVQYYKTEVEPHIKILPCDIAHYSMLIRPLILCSPQVENSENQEIYFLSTKKDDTITSIKLPLFKYDPRLISGPDVVLMFCQETVKIHPTSIKICGLLGVEHNGMTPKVTGAGDLHDGLLLTVVVKLDTVEKTVPEVTDRCAWTQVTNPELKEKLLKSYNATEACGPIPFMFR